MVSWLVKLIVKPRNSGGHGLGGQTFLSEYGGRDRASKLCGARGGAAIQTAKFDPLSNDPRNPRFYY